MRSYGVQGFQRYIRQVRIVSLSLVLLGLRNLQTIRRSDTFVSLIKHSAYFRLVTPPCLSLSVFRLVPPIAASNSTGSASAALSQTPHLNALNLAFHARLSARRDVAFTRTDLNGVICIRCAVGAARTEEVHIHQAFEVLCEVARETLKTWRGEGPCEQGKESA